MTPSRKRPDSLPRGIRRLFSLPQSRATLLRDADDEMRFHLDMWTREFIAQGMSGSDAEAAAMRRFGDARAYRHYAGERATRKARIDRAAEWLAEWMQDVHFALRHFRKAPAFTAIAVLTLALGIGANTAIFSVIHRMLIAPLPYPNGGRIVSLRLKSFGGSGPAFAGLVSISPDAPMNPRPQLVSAWQQRTKSLETIAGFVPEYLALDANGEQDTVSHVFVTANFLPTLGVRPVIGHGFSADDERGDSRVAMISYEWWQRAFGGRTDVLGKTMAYEGKLYTIVGVTPSGLTLPMTARALDQLSMTSPDMWLPGTIARTGSYIGLLRPGVDAADASRELDNIRQSLKTATAGPLGIKLDSVHALAMRAQDFLAPRDVQTMEVLFAAVGALLLIACANVANLLLVRAWSRRREFAIRMGLGAGRARLVRLALTESVFLALAAGVLGTLIAWEGLRVIVAMRPIALDSLATARIEPVVLAWTAGISLMTGIAFGGAAALFVSAQSTADLLRNETRTTSGTGATRRVRSSLIVLEVALSFTLLVGAGLLTRSFAALQRTPLGFDPRNLVSIDVFPGPILQRTTTRAAVRDGILDRLRRVPGVVRASAGTLPAAGYALPDSLVVASADGTERRLGLGRYLNTWIDSAYFTTSGIRMIAGRAPTLGATDDNLERPFASMTEEIVVGRSLANELAPGGNAVGMHVRAIANGGLPYNDAWSTVVGVVDDVRIPGAAIPNQPFQLYQLLARNSPMAFVVRFGGAVPPDVESVLRNALHEVYPTLIARRARLADDYLREAFAPTKFMLTLLGAFALVAIVLAGVGLYGTIAYTVSQRTREIGIRVAFGATPSAVRALVIRDGMRLVIGGLILGVVTAIVASRGLASLLYGIGASDPATFVAITLAVATIALAASYAPARRAVRIDPVDALRAD